MRQIYIYMYVYTYAQAHAYTCKFIRADRGCTQLQMSYINIYMNICTQHTRTHAYICICADRGRTQLRVSDIYIYIYTHTHAHTHTCIFVYAQIEGARKYRCLVSICTRIGTYTHIHTHAYMRRSRAHAITGA